MSRSLATNPGSSDSTPLPPSEPEVVLEAPPAVGVAEVHAGERGHDPPAQGGQARPWRRPRLGPRGGAFPPEPPVLQEGEGEQARRRVVVQPAPAPALE